MGEEIDHDHFDDAERERFSRRLSGCLSALAQLLEQPGFGVLERTIGAELEVSLVTANGRPLAENTRVLDASNDPRLTLELLRFNLETNLRHTRLSGRPFAHLARELDGALVEMRRAAGTCEGRVATIGILPTLRAGDLRHEAMTDLRRFHALSRSIRERRRAAFDLAIDGQDTLRMRWDDLTPEGANTSFQIHLSAAPREFSDLFNAAQLATAPVLAVSGNSPTFLGRRLWEETRVALFKQSVDDRDHERRARHDEPRVSFGRQWLRTGVLELFREGVELHQPLLPVLDDEDPLGALANGDTPRLAELRLHHGTIWRWNRPVYDPHEGGHLRIELRALPSGPTVADMVANAAFLVGLTLGLAPTVAALTEALPFARAEENFYRSAQSGLGARLMWPGLPAERTAGEVARRLLPTARRGLIEAGVEPAEVEQRLDVIDARISTGMTGAHWQRLQLAALERKLGRDDALAAMLERYLELSERGEPVHTWTVEPPG